VDGLEDHEADDWHERVECYSCGFYRGVAYVSGGFWAIDNNTSSGEYDYDFY
jgi:hypothetical protein